MAHFRFAAAAESLPEESLALRAHRALLPAGLTSEAALFDALEDALALPGYFGRNWDALYDCLCDLSWIDADSVELWHAELPGLSPAALGSYLRVLDAALESWRRDGADASPRLIVSFPESSRERVEAALAEDASCS